MIKRKKWKTDFPISRLTLNCAHVLETQIPLGHPVNFPFFEGLSTLRTERTNSDSVSDSPFLDPARRVKGFLESEGTARLDLTGKRKKIVKTLSGSVYHFFADDVCDILYALRIYPDAEVILDLSLISDTIEMPGRDFFGFFFDALADQGIKYKLIDSTKFDIIYINDYCVAESPYRSSISGELIYEFFKKYIDKPDTVPHRNVYLTRKKVVKSTENLEHTAAKLSYRKDERVDSEEALAEIFAGLGFEVIAPEDFSNFHEQLNFFYSVKTIASLTSSGLTNALFMQPGGTVIELSTPLVVLSPILSGERTIVDLAPEFREDYTIAQELHMFYKLIAYLKSHVYLSINNPCRSAKDLETTIHNNLKLFNFLDSNEQSNNI